MDEQQREVEKIDGMPGKRFQAIPYSPGKRIVIPPQTEELVIDMDAFKKRPEIRLPKTAGAKVSRKA